MKTSVKTVTGYGVLVATAIVLTRLGSLNVGPVRIGFGFLPVVLGGMLYGGAGAAIIAATADVIGAFFTGAWWWGFTVSAILNGVIYGVFLHKRPLSVTRTVLCLCIQTVFVEMFLGAYWYTLFAHYPYTAALFMRGINAAAMLLVKFFAIRCMDRFLTSHGNFLF